MSINPAESMDSNGRDDILMVFPKCDPLGLMRDAFLTPSLDSIHENDLLVAWVMSLSSRMDPALAARPIVSVLGARSRASGPCRRRRLVALLEEVCRFPRPELSKIAQERRRRRGLRLAT